MNRLSYIILLGFFLLSVLVRLPHLDRPLSKHHEFCTAIALIPLQNWAKHGAASYHFSPSITFEGAANQNIENLTAYPVEENGRFYYLSHPPLVYLLPHATFKILGIYPTPLALQVFNLFFHFLSCLFIYKIVLLLTAPPKANLHTGAFIAFLAYLFAPAALWFHGNVYMADMFVSNILIIGLYLALRVFRFPTENKFNKRYFAYWNLALALLIFAMIYTEWIGNFFAFGVFVFALAKARKQTTYLWTAGLAVLSVFAGLSLIFWQYSSIAGFETYWAYFEHRFFARGFTRFAEDGAFSFLYRYAHLLKGVLKHYAIGFLPLILLGIFLAYRRLQSPRQERATAKVVGTKDFLWLAGFPIFMHQLVFIEYTVVHDFAALKVGILIAVGLGWLARDLTGFKNLTGIGIAAAFSLCIVQYYYINRPGEINQNGDRYDMMQKLGEAIRDNTNEDEIVFLNGYKPEPQVMYYARRNMLRAADTTAVQKILEERQAERGVLFTIDYYTVKKIERVFNYE